MEEQSKRIIEINGAKFEVDLRQAKRIDEFRVGDKIKVLVKGYGETYDSYVGMICGFDDFKNLPSLKLAYLTAQGELKFVVFNEKTNNLEICACYDEDIELSKADVVRQMDKKISQAALDLEDLKLRKEYFLRNFGRVFELDEAAKTA